MLRSNAKILHIFLFLLLSCTWASASDILNCENGEGGDCSDTFILPALEDEDARGVFGAGSGYGLLNYFTTMVPATAHGTGRNKPLKFRFRFPYIEQEQPRPTYNFPTWEIKDRLGFAEPPLWGKRENKRDRNEPQRGRNEPQRGRQGPLRRGPPVLQTRSDDEIDDFNERKYQAYAEYYGLPYKNDRDGSSAKRRSQKNKNKKGKPNSSSNYSLEKSCEQNQSGRGCVKYYDSYGNEHRYENHPFSEEIEVTTPAPKRAKSSSKSGAKAVKGKRKGQKKPAPVVAPSIVGVQPVVSSYSLKQKNSNRRNGGNKGNKRNRRKGQNKGSTKIGRPEDQDDSIEGVDRETLQSLYDRNHAQRVTYKIRG